VEDGEGSRVDDAVQADIEKKMRRLLRVAILIHLGRQVVRARANTGIGEDMVNTAIDLLCLLEQGDLFGPDRDIGLDEGVRALRFLSRGLDIGIDHRGSLGQKEIDCGKTNAGRAS
jgi:hypothetical protein